LKIPTIKTLVLFFIVFIFTSLFLLIFNINFYDQNCSFNFLEKKIVEKQYKNSDTKKYFILNIETKITSEMFLDLLYFLEANEASYVIFDNQFINLSDYNKISDIKDFIKSSANIFSYVKGENDKGLEIFANKKFNNEEAIGSFNLLKTDSQFIFANYQKEIKLENQFGANPLNIGIIAERKQDFDKDNIDILYKFNNRFLFSLPMIAYSYEKKINLKDINVGISKLEYKDNVIYYDQKGKSSYISSINTKILNVNNFIDWKNALTLRSEVMSTLLKIELFSPLSLGINLFNDQEKIIDSVYQIPDIGDDQKNISLNIAKDKASQWKIFKNSYIGKIKDCAVIIVENGDYKWVSNFIYEKDVLTYGDNLKRIPIGYILVFSIVILFIFLLISIIIDLPLFLLFLGFFLSIFELSLYLIFRLFIGIDFPLLSFLTPTILGVILGLIIQIFSYNTWIKELKLIYKGSISKDLTKSILKSWKSNKWNFSSNQYVSFFLGADISLLTNKDFEKDEVETVGEKISEIELKMKNNFGILDSSSPNILTSYFGNPPVRKDCYKDAVKAGEEIINIPIVLNNNTIKINVALSAKNEWFKFIEKENVKYYTHFGNSANTLLGLLKYSKKFKIDFILTDAVYKLSNFSLPVRMLDKLKINGNSRSIRVFELLLDNKLAEVQEILEYFHAGLKLFENRKWEEAGAYFRQCLKLKEDDIPSQIYLQRCKDFIHIPPENNWDGSYEID